jgi:hypothetical protein
MSSSFFFKKKTTLHTHAQKIHLYISKIDNVEKLEKK